MSMITSCELGVFTTARRRLRVVCATGLVMATFSPMQALTSVDLPTLGLPTSATKPLLKGVLLSLLFSTCCSSMRQREFPFVSF